MKNVLLARQILKRVEKEQRARKLYVAGKAAKSEFQKLDRENTRWLKGVFKEHGWPTFSMVGRKAADGVWLMVQHADHDLAFQ